MFTAINMTEITLNIIVEVLPLLKALSKLDIGGIENVIDSTHTYIVTRRVVMQPYLETLI